MKRLGELNNIMEELQFKIKTICNTYNITNSKTCKTLYDLVTDLNNARVERDKLINH